MDPLQDAMLHESVLIQTSDQIEPEFLKKCITRGSGFVKDSQIFKETIEVEDDDESKTISEGGAIGMTHDIIGKNIKCYYREPEALDDVPLVFVQIYEYFMEDESRLRAKDLFSKLSVSEMGELDKLEMCFSMGDYNYIFSVQNPKIVAFYLKSVLKYMEEPLCTYQSYQAFRNLTNQNLKLEKVESMRHLFSSMDSVYQATWRLLIQFLSTLS
jgi:hypothetical protein